jgi:adenylate cyclase
VNVCDVARQLGVTHVLEGSVRKAGDRVRINAQLIDGETGAHVWAERYDRSLDDIFAIQDEISHAIVAALKLKLLPREKEAIEERGTNSADAYSYYLLARQFWLTGNFGDMRREQRVMRSCSRALEYDPYYARAWALLAMAQSNLRYGFRCQMDDGYAAANTALAIDPDIADAHCAMMRRLEDQQLYEEADVKMERALRLDPQSWNVNKEAARVYVRQGRVAEATRCLEKAVTLVDTDVHAWAKLITCYHALGDTDAMRNAAEMTVEQAEHVLAQDPSNGAAMGFRAIAHAALGQEDSAHAWMERGTVVDPDNGIMRYSFACAHAAYLGDNEKALHLLDRYLATATGFHLNIVEADPDLAPLRREQSFRDMLARAKRRLGRVEAAESVQVPAQVPGERV